MQKNNASKILFIRNSCTLTSHSQLGYGMAIIATIVHKAGYKTKAIDNNTNYKFYEDKDFVEIIKSFKPDIVAYNITLYNAYTTYEQIKKFKILFPNIIIVAGGIHMKHCFEEGLRNGVDIVVNREAEKVILPLLKHIGKKEKGKYKNGLAQIKGVSFVKKDGNFHFAKEFPYLKNMDDVPLINYNLLNMDDYVKTATEAGVFYFTGQRGCPFGCTFCSDGIQRKDKRMASADWLFKNVVNIYNKFKVPYISIADNNITLSRKRLVEFCNKMISSGLNKKITFSCQTTTRFPIDDELLSLMKKAGFGRINFGVERLTPYSLKKINKVQPLKTVHKVLSSVAKHGIDPAVFMMVGFPFETKKLLEKEKKLFLEITKHTKRLTLAVLAPTPGSIYYDNFPKAKDWYLSRDEYLLFRAYFTSVLDMHTSKILKRNFFDLPEETLKNISDYYLTIKKLNYGSMFIKKSPVISVCLTLDYFVAKLSESIFAVSPSLEFILFHRLKSIRYYLGNYFFSSNILNK